MRPLAVVLATSVAATALMVPLGGCAGAPRPTPGAAVPAATSVQLTALRQAFSSASLPVTSSPAGDSTIFGVASREVPLSAGGADVQVYEFPSSGDASSAASTVDPGGTAISTQNGDGTGQTQNISWAGRPHFFRRDRLLVFYLSQTSTATPLDRRVLGVLKQQMGPQFAGDTDTR